ncbi:MAG: hypothetical protein E6G34_10620 [Actinobacteria bacterium]|nr:MAG: hypothetical protein E6G34_10620 [Actinomycetota bacterium]
MRRSPHRAPVHRQARRLALALAAAACALLAPLAGGAAAQPVNNTRPEVVGNPLVGERLVCAAGSWSGGVQEFRYAWIRDGVHFASGVTYTVAAGDKGHTLWCAVTAVEGAGGPGHEAQAESSNSLLIPGGTAPEAKVPPEVSGTPALGEALSCSTGTWSGTAPISYAYQWLRDGSPIGGATQSIYAIVEADQGHSLACEVTASNAAGSGRERSKNSVSVPGSPPESAAPPQVLGIAPAQVGESLTCFAGTWAGSPPPTFSYQWLRDGTSIAGATNGIYTVRSEDQLHTLSCRVRATNVAGSAEAPSANSIAVRGAKPVNVTAPSVGGTPAVGATLTCEKGTWTGVPAPTYTYLWVRDVGTSEEVGLSSSINYLATFADRGHSLTCKVTATNREGQATAASEQVVIPEKISGGKAPVNETPPQVSGTPALGVQLSCSTGTWSATPDPTFTYQWRRDGAAIPGATAATYKVVEADQGHALTCVVTAVNGEGATEASSESVNVPGSPPEPVEAPAVFGTPAVGQQLTCLKGIWKGQPPPSFTYAWLRDGTSIPGATSSTYTASGADEGHVLTCVVTATNNAGTAKAESSNGASIPGQAPIPLTAPELSGTPAVGHLLTCSRGTWAGTPEPSYSYSWSVNGTEVPSASENTLTVASAYRGLDVTCIVTATNREGSASAHSNRIHIPGEKPEVVEKPEVSGTPAVGEKLTCVRGIWKGQPPPAFAYQWLRDGVSIAAATSSTYTAEGADLGHLLSCHVVATNSEGGAEAESSGVAIRRAAQQPVGQQEVLGLSASLPLAVQIQNALRVQLARAMHHVHLASLRKTGVFSFPFAPPVAGTLEVGWYQVRPGANWRNTNRNAVLLAKATLTLNGTAAKTMTLRLTSAGRSTIAQHKRVPVTVNGMFAPLHERRVLWQLWYLLSH